MQPHELDRLLTRMLEAYGPVSDLNFTANKPPQVELNGQLVPVTTDPPIERLTPFQTEAVALALIGSDRRLTETFVRTGSCDLPYALGTTARFRVNIFQQRGQTSIVLRRLASEVPTIEGMGLPPVIRKLSEPRNGLILVTGATGSGKSTTLAAVLDIINENKAVHVVTLEDPVEFVFPVKKATFNQRELGTDFDSFANGLRAAMRQAPKVILVGEMRDRETLEIGLSAAETGHLVMSTLHTMNAGQTINRMLGMFDKDEERMMRMRLADTLRWIVCQRLLPKVGGGRVAALEVMGMNLRVEEVILNGESEGKTYYEIIQDGETLGMQTFDTHILQLFREGLITEETALSYASRRSVVARGLDQYKAGKGEKTSDIDGLAMDAEYAKPSDPRQRRRAVPHHEESGDERHLSRLHGYSHDSRRAGAQGQSGNRRLPPLQGAHLHRHDGGRSAARSPHARRTAARRRARGLPGAGAAARARMRECPRGASAGHRHPEADRLRPALLQGLRRSHRAVAPLRLRHCRLE